MTKKKVEFGDFQTPLALAQDVVELARKVYPNPSSILEPTCGLGAFIKASVKLWPHSTKHYGFDLNQEYIAVLKKEFANNKHCQVEMSDFFTKDWKRFFEKNSARWLVIGNPPWVTNSTLGALESKNLPVKSNFQKVNGFEAKTGKANFDIAEWILMRLIGSLQESSACVAMLCKTATARKVLRHFWNRDANIHNTSIHRIDAAKHFGVSVEACLFLTCVGCSKKQNDAKLYSGLSFENQIGHIGIANDELIADIDLYEKYKHIDGDTIYGWRSGLKHDAAKVMELRKSNGKYVNGHKEHIELEDKYVFPLLKSSDIANQRLKPERYVIVTQRKTSDDTSHIRTNAPKTWAYLEKYSGKLDTRKSIIYRKRPRFSVFGIGDYSFSPWKVVISGLYKNCVFSVIGNENKKPVMVDDTCYSLPCRSRKEAALVCDLLNSDPCKNFIKSLVFLDSKRPVNIELLKRIDLSALAKEFGRYDEFLKCNHSSGVLFPHTCGVLFPHR
ncbi:MAG: SAM-dependent DNA methyltransferase [Planctomycetes bacterium]|nr:SAM-dependent DNA methyltransferase [Planctomycetota bacterium]